jgi:hypothetical protein
MRVSRLLRGAVPALFLSLSGAGSAGALEQDGRLWVTLLLRSPAWEKLRVDLLMQVRTQSDMSEFGVAVVRPSLSYLLSDRIALTLGYDALVVRGALDFEEHRVWQELLLQTPVRRIGITHRLRLEQRFIGPIDGVAVRLRYLLGLSSPAFAGGFRGVFRNEIFLNLNSPAPVLEPVFAENRAFWGVQRPFAEHLSWELGYQAQWLRLPADDLLAHILMAGVSVSFK